MSEKLDTIEHIRFFNRFYTAKLKLLNNSYLNSKYSAAEARILFEIFENKKCSANFIAEKLHIDKGYLSRIIKRFESCRLIERAPSEKDARFFNITLTKNGIELTKELIKKSNLDIENLIQNLTLEDCKKLVSAMNTIVEKMENAK